MKKVLLVLGIICAMMLAGCGAEKTPKVENSDTEAHNEVMANQEKFMHGGETYTPELFVEMANTYEGTLDGEGQQDYVFDLRSKENYDKGHIVGAVNIEFNPEDAESVIEKIPSDWSVYIIGDDDTEAKTMRNSLKAIDEQLDVYVIEGGYDALSKAEGIEKFITTVPGEFADFTRTEAAKEFDELVEQGIIKEAE